jgi:hypothetical protein
MIFNLYLARQVAGERRKDAVREAEQERLIRAVQGPREARIGRLREASILSSARAILMDHRGDEPRRRSPSTASSST